MFQVVFGKYTYNTVMHFSSVALTEFRGCILISKEFFNIIRQRSPPPPPPPHIISVNFFTRHNISSVIH